MTTIEESVINTMDGRDKELFDFLPYMLQDIWEMGTSPGIVSSLINKNFPNASELKILDLGCGKGAVSIYLAGKFHCRCHGIDAVKEFIDTARMKADDFDVSSLCSFEVGDIRLQTKELTGYNAVILGAVGPVLGNYYETLTLLSNCITHDGVIIIDDCYIEDGSNFTHHMSENRNEIYKQIKKAGMFILDEAIVSKEEIKKSNEFIFNQIEKRCFELMLLHPEKSKLFSDYVNRQRSENRILENYVVCVVFVIKKMKTNTNILKKISDEKR